MVFLSWQEPLGGEEEEREHTQKSISWCDWEQESVPPGEITLPWSAKQRSWGSPCSFVPMAQEAGLEKATKWLRYGQQVLCRDG